MVSCKWEGPSSHSDPDHPRIALFLKLKPQGEMSPYPSPRSTRSVHSPASPEYTQPPSFTCPALWKTSCSPGQHPCQAGPNKTHHRSAAAQAACRAQAVKMNCRKGPGAESLRRRIRCNENAPLGGGLVPMAVFKL